MARYTGPKCRLCRREGVKLFLKGDRCYTDKCAFERRPYPPGQHGRRRKKSTDYEIHLREKQKVRRIYGVLERQFKRYFEIAESKKGITGENLLRMLELRLDNVVYRLGFAVSRDQARQLVTHGHILVNGKKADIPSMQLKVNDVVSVAEKSKDIPFIKEAQETLARREVPKWLEVDPEKLVGKVKALPERDDITFPVNENLIVEFYSR